MTTTFQRRRDLLTGGAAILAAAWAGTLVQSQVFPTAGATTEAAPVEIPLSDLPAGSVKQVVYAGAPALVMRTEDGVVAFSMVCTHLACQVQWQPGPRQFYCACHGGRFDEFGEVLAGPPPLPLERLPVKVLADRVVVGEAT